MRSSSRSRRRVGRCGENKPKPCRSRLMCGVIVHTKLTLDQAGHSRTGPQVRGQSHSQGALQQQAPQSREITRAQTPRPTASRRSLPRRMYRRGARPPCSVARCVDPHRSDGRPRPVQNPHRADARRALGAAQTPVDFPKDALRCTSGSQLRTLVTQGSKVNALSRFLVYFRCGLQCACCNCARVCINKLGLPAAIKEHKAEVSGEAGVVNR
jgi:hypothetical protein